MIFVLKKLAIIKRIAILLDVLTEEYEKVLNHDDTESKRVFYYLDLIEKAIQVCARVCVLLSISLLQQNGLYSKDTYLKVSSNVMFSYC